MYFPNPWLPYDRKLITLIITNYLLVASAPAGRNPFEKGLSSSATPSNAFVSLKPTRTYYLSLFPKTFGLLPAVRIVSENVKNVRNNGSTFILYKLKRFV